MAVQDLSFTEYWACELDFSRQYVQSRPQGYIGMQPKKNVMYLIAVTHQTTVSSAAADHLRMLPG